MCIVHRSGHASLKAFEILFAIRGILLEKTQKLLTLPSHSSETVEYDSWLTLRNQNAKFLIGSIKSLKT